MRTTSEKLFAAAIRLEAMHAEKRARYDGAKDLVREASRLANDEKQAEPVRAMAHRTVRAVSQLMMSCIRLQNAIAQLKQLGSLRKQAEELGLDI